MSEEKKLTDEKTIEVAEDINVPNKTELSDEDIKKSLECCTELGRCRECPYFIKKIDCIPDQRHEKDILDFIHRLQSENAEYSALLEKAIMDYYAASQTCDEQSEMIRTDKSPNGWFCINCYNAELDPFYGMEEEW